MKNLTTVSRLACLTIVLAAGTMMATANIANAKGDRHQDNKAQNNGARPHGMMSGKPVGVKKVLHDRKDCRKKDCERADANQNQYEAGPANGSRRRARAPVRRQRPACRREARGGRPHRNNIEWCDHLRHIQRQRPDRNSRKPDEHHGDEQQSQLGDTGRTVRDFARCCIHTNWPGHGSSPLAKRRRHDRNQACGCRRTNKTDATRSWPRR